MRNIHKCEEKLIQNINDDRDSTKKLQSFIPK